MYLILPSYSGSHRIYIQASRSRGTHAILKENSMWGGHDKTEEFDFGLCFGYEIRDEKLGTVIDMLVKLGNGPDRSECS